MASTRSAATAASNSATSGAAGKTCSKLSSTSSVGVPLHAERTRACRSSAVASTRPSASAIAGATSAALRRAANLTNSTRTPSDACARASSSARRVFPAPPGPVSVIRRAVGSASHAASVCTSASRPSSVVSGCGSETSRSWSTAAVGAAGRALSTRAARAVPVRSSADDNARTVSTWGRRRCPRSSALTA